MAERGAQPKVPAWRLKALRALRAFFTPLLPDDYLELINPLWSTQELRGRIERIERETADAVTVVIRPGWEWPGHEPGPVPAHRHGGRRHAPLARVLDHLRPGPPGRLHQHHAEAGRGGQGVAVSGRARRGPGRSCGSAESRARSCCPSRCRRRLLFISAGSGITPIMSMLRSLDRRGGLADVVHLHSARTADDVIFGAQLRELDERNAGFRLHLQLTGERGPLTPGRPRRAVPRLARARGVRVRARPRCSTR